MADISLLPTTGELRGLETVQKINEGLTSLNEANRLGIPAWSSTTSYGAGALTWDAGQTYKSTVANSGQRPSTTPASWVSWGLTLSDLQNGYETMATAAGTANALTVEYWPAIDSLSHGQTLRFRASLINIGACTLAVNAMPASPIRHLSGTALRGGELAVGGVCTVQWSVPASAFILLASTGGSFIPEDYGISSPPAFRNRLINGNFSVNQLGLSGTVTLAAGAFAHDGFRAGAGGCTYTFTKSGGVTTLTISAGTLQQTIDGNDLISGAHVLSWAGSAQGRIDGGAYGASGMTGTATSGTNQVCEWGSGTLSRVQYERGNGATVFEHLPIEADEQRCRRRYTTGFAVLEANGIASQSISTYVDLGVSMRAAPTITVTDNGSVYMAVSFSGVSPSVNGFRLRGTKDASGGAFLMTTRWVADARL